MNTMNDREAIIDAFRADARWYLTGYNGGDRPVPNAVFHHSLKKILQQPDPRLIDMADVNWLIPVLAYRISLEKLATTLLINADVPLPYGCSFHGWNAGIGRFNKEYPFSEEESAIWHKVIKAEIFPEPEDDEGTSMDFKGFTAHYVASALVVAGYDEVQVDRKLALMKACSDMLRNDGKENASKDDGFLKALRVFCKDMGCRVKHTLRRWSCGK